MNNTKAALAMALAASLSAPALAQAGEQRTTLIYGDTQLALEFQPNCSPGLDCPYFALTCSVAEVSLFVLNLDIGHIERWAQGNEPASLRIAESVFTFTPDRMIEEEEGWFVLLEPDEDPTDLLFAVYDGGDVIMLGTPFYLFEVEPIQADLDNMHDFGVGCLGATAP
jgi:hypothetical protein